MPGKKKPTDEDKKLVENMAGVGLPYQMIADIIDYDKDTLVKHFRRELSRGKAKSTAAVANSLYKKAISGDTASMIFWLKAQAGWRELSPEERKVSPEDIAKAVRDLRAAAEA
ncbi:MAG: hypothetical protein ACRCWJ_22235 [Casimicrobium sp.]